jgi:hypothetical protein
MEAEEDDDSGLPSSLSAMKTDSLFPHIPPNRLTFDICDFVSVLFLIFVGLITRVIRVQYPEISFFRGGPSVHVEGLSLRDWFSTD